MQLIYLILVVFIIEFKLSSTINLSWATRERKKCRRCCSCLSDNRDYRIFVIYISISNVCRQYKWESYYCWVEKLSKREEESNRMHQLTRRLKTSIVESYYNMLLSINLVVYCKLIVISRTIYYYGQQIRPW